MTRMIAAPAGQTLAVLVLSWAMIADAHAASAAGQTAVEAAKAEFHDATASADAHRVADWAVTSEDNTGLPFVIIDKIRATVFVFDRAGHLLGASLALLGLAHGDNSVPGIGSRKLSSIRPEERTTPAGRFVAALGRDLKGDILWIDYKNAISLHRVIDGSPGDHRRERLATTSLLDKRISFGCINVPVKFYEEIVLRAFAGTSGIVYILPETKPLQDVFPLIAGDVAAKSVR